MNNPTPSPPRYPQRVLGWFLKKELLEEVLGDLEEKYQYTQKNKSTTKAKLNYWYQVLHYLQPFAIKYFRSNCKFFIMYQHNLKIAFRHLLKDKGYSFINVFSLTVGIAACMVIYLFIADEKSFDSWHTKKEQIYRIDEIQNFTGTKEQKVALSMPGMGPNMLKEFLEVINYTRYLPEGKMLLKKEEISQTVDKVFSVDSTFLKIFDYPLKYGNASTALDRPHTMLITEETALKFFDNLGEATGSTLSIGDTDYEVTGVLYDVPDNSHLQFDVLISMTTFTKYDPEFDNQFGGNFLNTYLLLEQNANVNGLEAKFDDFMVRHTDNEDIVNSYEVYLQPLGDIHLGSADIEHDYNNYRKFDGKYLNTFALVGLFILIIASVNFMNLSIARSSQRWKEIGVRKAVGAQKIELFNQFILESIILAIIALILAYFINFLCIPLLNDLTGRHLSLWYFIDHPLSLAVIVGATVGLGILSGLYPSLYLAAMKAVNILKGKGSNSQEGKSILKNALIMLQFGLALAMIVSTLIVLQQLNYMNNKDIGFDKEHILLVSMNDKSNEAFKEIKNDLLQLESVKGVTASGQRLGNNFHQWGFKVKMDTGIYDLTPSNVHVEYDYFDVYNIKIKEGRAFSRDYATDEGLAYIINESMVKELGLTNPVGTPAAHGWYPNDSLGTIIGVVPDFNFNSLHHKVNTLAMSVHSKWNYNEMSIKIKANNIHESLQQIETVWDKHIDNWPFEYEFLDDHFATLYESDNQMSYVVSIMTILSILIACMGLFGLSAIMVGQKIKEVGIRKVLGASASQITYLLSKNFLILVMVSFLIVSPVAYYFLNDWLRSFAFHIEVDILIFIIGAVVALLIAFFTISFHTIRTSRRNPVEALRYE